MHIAFIAHDRKKDEMVNFTTAYRDLLKHHTLYATGTTGTRIMEATGLEINRFCSGPLGGDQQIGALVAINQLDCVVFLRDPLMAQPHEPDIMALLRLCDVQEIPLATNLATAELLLRAMEQGELSWRETVRGKQNRKNE